MKGLTTGATYLKNPALPQFPAEKSLFCFPAIRAGNSSTIAASHEYCYRFLFIKFGHKQLHMQLGIWNYWQASFLIFQLLMVSNIHQAHERRKLHRNDGLTHLLIDQRFATPVPCPQKATTDREFSSSSCQLGEDCRSSNWLSGKSTLFRQSQERGQRLSLLDKKGHFLER